MKKIAAILIGCLVFVMLSLNFEYAAAEEYPYPSLYKAYNKYFDISAAVEPDDLTQYPELAKEQFNVIVTENAMKPWIHQGENKWWWNSADSIVEYAQKNNKKVRKMVL